MTDKKRQLAVFSAWAMHMACGRRLAGLLMLILCVGAMPLAWSRAVLDLDSSRQPVALEDWGDYRIEAGEAAGPAEIITAPAVDWLPTSGDIIYPLDKDHALWIRIRVPPAPDSERWYLEVPNSSLAAVSLFALDSSGRWTEEKAGDRVPVAKWPVPHRHPLLPISLSAEVPGTYLLKIVNGSSISLPLRFISESYLGRSEQRISLALGIFFGLAFLAALTSALSAGSLRDPAYAYYAISVLLMALTQAARSGIAGVHLWPDSPSWKEVSLPVLQTLQLAPLMLFVSAAISLYERSLILHRILVSLALAGLLASAALAMVPVEYRTAIFTSYGLVSQVTATACVIWAWRRGDRFAPWLILAFAPVVIAAAWLRASSAGLVPIGFWALYGTQIGVALELPVVMVILLLRSQQKRENIRRLHGLDRVDPATGLINEHVFSERLGRMAARSRRLKHKSAVLVIDIMNTAQIQREFGKKAAEDLPLHVAERLLSTAREIDSAARLSESRFGMLVEGPFTARDIETLGPRIVARCLMPYKGGHVDCVAQVRLAYALVPDRELTAQAVVAALEEKLASISREERRAVFVLCETTIPFHVPPHGSAGFLGA